jgi:RNA polymerase sigma-70 factor (ECF subfamily)
MPLDPQELIPTRATLIDRLKNWEDRTSWQQFFDTYWRLIYSVARKAGLNDVESQDVVQETMISTAKNLPGFKYDPAIGSFKGWLLKMTRWRITDQFRKRGPSNRHHLNGESDETTDRTGTIGNVADPAEFCLDQIWTDEWQSNLLEVAITNVRRKIDPQKYQIFDLYVNKGWPPEKVAKTLGVSINLVYVAKHRVTELIKEEVTRIEKDMT